MVIPSLPFPIVYLLILPSPSNLSYWVQTPIWADTGTHFPKDTNFQKGSIHWCWFGFTTVQMVVKHCSLFQQVTRNQHHWCWPRVRCIPLGSGTGPCSSSPLLPLPLHCYLRPPEITRTQQKSCHQELLQMANCHSLTVLSEP